MLGDPMEITAREPRKSRGLASRRSLFLSVARVYTPREWRTPGGKNTSGPARDAAPTVNSPTPRGTVDHRVTVSEKEGWLLTASRLLSPRERTQRAKRPSRTR